LILVVVREDVWKGKKGERKKLLTRDPVAVIAPPTSFPHQDRIGRENECFTKAKNHGKKREGLVEREKIPLGLMGIKVTL